MKHLYDEEYYAVYGDDGTPYQDNPNIINTMGSVAYFLRYGLEEFNSHLDVGCAMGYLVEAMNNYGIISRGLDFSEYAIAHALPSVAWMLRVHDVIRPIGYTYDLVTCIEVVEHISPEHEQRVIQNLCNASNKYIYFSSANNPDEPTHVNVKPMGHWIGMFERFGFKYKKIEHYNNPIAWGFVVERVEDGS